MDRSYLNARHGRFDSADSKAKSKPCRFCRQPIRPVASLVTLWEGPSPICGDCYHRLAILDYSFKWQGFKTWVWYASVGLVEQWIQQWEVTRDGQFLADLWIPFAGLWRDFKGSHNLLFLVPPFGQKEGLNKDVLAPLKEYLAPSLGQRLLGTTLSWNIASLNDSAYRILREMPSASKPILIILGTANLKELKKWIDQAPTHLLQGSQIILFAISCRDVKESVAQKTFHRLIEKFILNLQ